MVSFFYTNSFLYNLMLNLIHGGFLKKRYSLISKIIGKNKKVLEIGCGTSLIYPYLDKSVSYEGWDLNKNFINESKKKGLNVKLKSAFDYNSYKKVDVILIVDVLHHVVPRHEELIKKIKSKAKMIIIAEPFNSKSSFLGWLNRSNNKPIKYLLKAYNRAMGDNDGINKPDVLFDWNYDEKSLKALFNKMGAKKVISLGTDLIALI
jgi:SAM-dependent methyltransferase